MAAIERTAEAIWRGDLRGGNGNFSSTSGLFQDIPYSFATRFEHAPGTNPEELIAAAHASCYSMAFANTLSQKGYKVDQIHTRATIVLARKPEGGFQITTSRLETRGQVEDIDDDTFRQIAKEGERNCPVSNALRGSLKIELDASLM